MSRESIELAVGDFTRLEVEAIVHAAHTTLDIDPKTLPDFS